MGHGLRARRSINDAKGTEMMWKWGYLDENALKYGRDKDKTSKEWIGCHRRGDRGGGKEKRTTTTLNRCKKGFSVFLCYIVV